MFFKTTSFAYTEDLEKKVVLKRRKPESIVSFSFSSDMYDKSEFITMKFTLLKDTFYYFEYSLVIYMI